VQLIWEEFLKIIKEEAGSQVVETWFKAVIFKEWDAPNKTVLLKAPNQFVKRWIQQHYIDLIKTHLKRLLNTDLVNVTFVCNDLVLNNNKSIEPETIQRYELNKTRPTRNIIPASLLQNNNSLIIRKNNSYPIKYKTKKNKPVSLNESYTFDSFIVGPNNSLAHAAAWAICQNPGKVYNPLLIYGGTGLGKTHLMHAIGNEVKKNYRNCLVSYQSTDRFTTEFINSIRFDKTHQFREKYTKIDLLLLDDIQFLTNKEQTQEMFFHIFNIFYEQKKQIILSSDTFPNEIAGLQSRLRSRLEWGLVADIQTPDLETKMAILEKKAEIHAIKLTQDVAQFIASRITSNIRELEGALIRVGAFATLTNQHITLGMAQKILLYLDENKTEKDGVMLDKILKIVAKTYKTPINEIKSKKRSKDIAAVRQISFYMMKKLSRSSLQTIGEYIGRRDHSTVLHAINKVEKMIAEDHYLGQKLKDLEQRILTS